MILNAAEVKTCLCFIIMPYLKKYDMHINDISLKLDQKLSIDTHIEYASKLMHIQGTCYLNYQNNQLIFHHIEGQVDYLFVSMKLIQILQQYVHHQRITINENNLYCHIYLPIKELTLKDELLYLKLDEM